MGGDSLRNEKSEHGAVFGTSDGADAAVGCEEGEGFES